MPVRNKMTDLVEETNQEMEVSEDETEEKNEIGGAHGRSDFLYELNLIVTVLSLFSLSSEDCRDGSEEDVKIAVKDDEVKAAVSASTRKRERDIHDQKKPLVRRAQRFQPMIKDSRHGRKM